MHLRVTSIASGSSGNATLVEAGDTKVLVDAGMTVKRVSYELKTLLIDPADLGAVFLTHDHGDHVGAVGALSRKYKIPVVGNEQTLVGANLGKAEMAVQATGTAMKVGELSVTSFALPHDATEPVGYLLEYGHWKVCIATDLGYVPETIKEFVHGSDLIILESNHDLKRLTNGPYSSWLKTRILGYEGHLSNQQAAECIGACASGRPQWLWLAHLSEINNSPRCALKTVGKHLQQTGVETVRVDAALRDRRSLIWESDNAWIQPRLF